MAQTLLLIHDDAAFAKIVQNALFKSRDGPFVIEWVRRCARGLARLSNEGKAVIAAILSNLFLPDRVRRGLSPKTMLA
jgi:hypothetical protein